MTNTEREQTESSRRRKFFVLTILNCGVSGDGKVPLILLFLK